MSDGKSLEEAFGAGERTGRFANAIATVRISRRPRRVALVVAAAVGIGLAWIHWLGLIAAGALVGLVSRDLPRAVAAGVVVGVLVLFVQVLVSPGLGTAEFLALAPASTVAVAIGVLAPLWGSLVRAVL